MHIVSVMLVGVVLLFVARSHAQGCCGMGSSLVAGGHPVLDKGTLLVQGSAEYSQAVNPTRDRRAAVLNASYGLTGRFSLSLRTNYAWLHSEFDRPAVVYSGTVLKPDTTIIYDNHGFGDGLIGAQYALIAMGPVTRQELLAGLDLGLPWGPAQKASAGVELPENMQTGSGGLSLGGYVAYRKAFPGSKLAAAANLAGRIKFRNRRGEEPGDDASFLLALISGPFAVFRPAMSLNYKATGATIGVDGDEKVATAGQRLDLIPSLEISFTPRCMAVIDAELPLWRDTYQKRYGNTFGCHAMVLVFLPLLR